MKIAINLLIAMLTYVPSVRAHESRPAYLEINETAPGRYHVLWWTPLLLGMRLPVSLKFPDEVRVAGSWIGAIGLFMLGWFVRGAG